MAEILPRPFGLLVPKKNIPPKTLSPISLHSCKEIRKKVFGGTRWKSSEGDGKDKLLSHSISDAGRIIRIYSRIAL